MLPKYKKWLLPFLFFYGIILFNQNLVIGCDICGIGGFGGSKGALKDQSISTPEITRKNRVSLGFLFEYRNWKHFGPHKAHELHEEDRDAHSRRYDLVYNAIFGYGITDNLSVTVQVPYVDINTRQVEEEEFIGQHERSNDIGDIITFGKYRFYNKLFGATAILGIKAPTGKTDKRDKLGNRFEPEEQPGTGSTDWIFGMALNKGLGRFTIDGSILYQFKGSGSQDYEFGDIVRVNIDGAYTVKERGSYPGLELLAGINAQFAEKDHQNAEKIRDTGGTTIFFSPGLSSQITENISSSISVPLPILQNLGGDHQEVDYLVLFSMGYSF